MTVGLFTFSDDILEQQDEAVQAGQVQSLARSVDSAEGGAEGYHVQMRVFVQEESALQSGVDGPHYGILAEEAAVGGLADLEDVGLQAGLPAGILGLVGDFGSGYAEGGLDAGGGVAAGGVGRAALAGAYADYAAFLHLDRGEVGGCLH